MRGRRALNAMDHFMPKTWKLTVLTQTPMSYESRELHMETVLFFECIKFIDPFIHHEKYVCIIYTSDALGK